MNHRFLDDYDAFLIDVDGVLLRGTDTIKGAANALRDLKRRGRVLLVTNGSTRSRHQWARHLEAHGFQVNDDEILPSSFTAAQYLYKLCGSSSVWLVGEQGLHDELLLAGHRIAERPEAADWVVAGMDRSFTYEALSRALDALLNGARLLATNEDATFPSSGGLLPGAGSIVGAFRGMGFPPEVVVGKPSPITFQVALEVLSQTPERIVTIGDRLETDVAGGNLAGTDTALVLTGISTREDVDRLGIHPTWIADSVAALARGEAARFVPAS